MQVQYAKKLKRSAYAYAYTYYIIYGRKLYKMLIVPCANLTRISLKIRSKVAYTLFHLYKMIKFWLVLYRFNMHKTKALRQESYYHGCFVKTNTRPNISLPVHII